MLYPILKLSSFIRAPSKIYIYYFSCVNAILYDVGCTSKIAPCHSQNLEYNKIQNAFSRIVLEIKFLVSRAGYCSNRAPKRKWGQTFPRRHARPLAGVAGELAPVAVGIRHVLVARGLSAARVTIWRAPGRVPGRGCVATCACGAPLPGATSEMRRFGSRERRW